MLSEPTSKALELLEDCLEELENSNGSIQSGVQKLARAADILDEKDIYIWCKIQLGNTKYRMSLKEYADVFIDLIEESTEEKRSRLKEIRKELEDLGLKEELHFSKTEIAIKGRKSAGGYENIGFVEEKYADLVRRKKGNDGTYYKSELLRNINYVKEVAHDKATKLYNDLIFSKTPKTVMDTLKEKVNDKLLDLDPELAEKIMLAFQSVTKESKESWSQALTSCRRSIENLADALYPPKDKKVNGREVGQAQYINRIWAFMDEAIKSESNRELAKAHVDILGKYLKRIHKLTNKGVHANLERIEAIKTVVHTYLMIADIIDYLDDESFEEEKRVNIYSASLDELQSFLDVSKSIAKEIVKLRVEKQNLSHSDLKKIKGIGPKTVEKAKKNFSFKNRS